MIYRTLIGLAAVVTLGCVSAPTNALAADHQGGNRGNGGRAAAVHASGGHLMASYSGGGHVARYGCSTPALHRFTMDRSTTGRSITAAPATTLSTADAPAMAFHLSTV